MSNQIIVQNQLISYISTQPAGDKCLLFLHGWRSNKEVWDEVVLKIKDKTRLPDGQGLGIYAFDLPGFGGSPVPKASWTVEDYANLVKAFIEKMELKNVVLVGHSFGGRIGIKLASLYPEVLFKLVLVDSAGFVDRSFKKKFFSLLSKIVKPIFAFSIFRGLRKIIYLKIGAGDFIATPDLKNIFLKVVNEDLTEDMKKINIPTLIIWGNDDHETPVEFGQKMSSIISNSKFIILPGAGHYSFLEKLEEFVKIASDFISSSHT